MHHLTESVEVLQVGFVEGVAHDFYVHVIQVLHPSFQTMRLGSVLNAS